MHPAKGSGQVQRIALDVAANGNRGSILAVVERWDALEVDVLPLLDRDTVGVLALMQSPGESEKRLA
jgi:hypothetical protein